MNNTTVFYKLRVSCPCPHQTDTTHNLQAEGPLSPQPSCSGYRKFQNQQKLKHQRLLVFNGMSDNTRLFPAGLRLNHSRAPSHNTSTPSHNTSTLNHNTSTPSHDTSTPSHDTSTLNQNTSTLNHNTSTLNHNTSTPSHDTSTLNHNTSTLNHNTSTPSHDTSTLNHNTSTPSHDTSTLNHNTSTPSHDTSTLSHNTSALNQNTSTLNHNTSTLNHNTSTLNHNTSTPSHDTSTLNHNTSTMSHDTSTLSHNTSALNQNTSTLNQNTSTMSHDTSALSHEARRHPAKRAADRHTDCDVKTSNIVSRDIPADCLLKTDNNVNNTKYPDDSSSDFIATNTETAGMRHETDVHGMPTLRQTKGRCPHAIKQTCQCNTKTQCCFGCRCNHVQNLPEKSDHREEACVRDCHCTDVCHVVVEQDVLSERRTAGNLKCVHIRDANVGPLALRAIQQLPAALSDGMHAKPAQTLEKQHDANNALVRYAKPLVGASNCPCQSSDKDSQAKENMSDGSFKSAITSEEYNSIWKRVSSRPAASGKLFIFRRLNPPEGIGEKEYIQGTSLLTKTEEQRRKVKCSNGENESDVFSNQARPLTAPTRNSNRRLRKESEQTLFRPFSHTGVRRRQSDLSSEVSSAQRLQAVQQDLIVTALSFFCHTASKPATTRNHLKESSNSHEENGSKLFALPAKTTSCLSTKIYMQLGPNKSDQMDTVDRISRSYTRRSKSAPPHKAPKCYSPNPIAASVDWDHPLDVNKQHGQPSLYWRARSAYHRKLLTCTQGPPDEAVVLRGSLWRPLLLTNSQSDGRTLQHSAGCPYKCKGCFKACLVSEDYLRKTRAQVRSSAETKQPFKRLETRNCGRPSDRSRPKFKVQDPQNPISLALARSQPLYQMVHDKASHRPVLDATVPP